MSIFGPPAFATAVLRALIAGETPMIATAASFSVSAGSFSTENRAAAFAAALDASGLPILVRRRPEDGRYQVLVGPYVSTDEAERAQRTLAAWGLGEPRLVVDDTMRSRPEREAVFGVGDADDGVLMVAATGMSSVVFEMRHAPREVELHRTGATTLDVSIGQPAGDSGQLDPAGSAFEALSLPDGVPLVRDVWVAPAGTGRAVRARLSVPGGVQSRLRLEGRRVYVDLAWPRAPWQVGDRLPSAKGAGARHVVSDPTTAADDSREQLRLAIERFQQIQPFLLSAVESPEPDVLAALSHSLEGLRASLADLRAPTQRDLTHQTLLASVTLASSALTPAFSGDRAATVRQSIVLFEHAQK